MRNFFTNKNTFQNPLFIGTVEDNNDPTQNYRVKVRINKLHNELITTEQLPWAARVDTAFMGMSDTADLNHKIPEVGSKVLLLAVGDDVNSLLYLGSLYKKTPQTPAAEDYLNTYGIYRPNGQFIGIDKIKKLFQMLFDGDINIDLIKEMTINVSNSVKITCQNANIKATQVTIDAPTTDMTGNLNVKGNIKSMQEVSAMGGAVNLSTHTHIYTPRPGGPTPTAPGQG